MSEEKARINIEDADIFWTNFSGREDKFNRAGVRNFCVMIDDIDVAMKMKNDGWNIKPLKKHDEDEEDSFYIQVAVAYGYAPPTIYIKSGDNDLVELDEDTIGNLDNMDIIKADLVITPYAWEVNGNSGVKAYLKTGYFVIEEDPFANKYRKPF